jgi:segregation and condensation protein A
MSSPFRLDLPAYRGPLDLLLFLVKRDELDATALSLSKVVDQYQQYLEVLKELDLDGVGEFIDVASQLVELKCRLCLPQQADSGDDEQAVDDPREQLVRRLMEYGRARDAASMLDELAERWQRRYRRQAIDLPPRTSEIGQQPIADLEIWDLVSAFGRILREHREPPAERVIFDETPLSHYMKVIHGRVKSDGEVRLDDLFAVGMHKSAMIGLFIALLELTRHHGVKAEQPFAPGDIMISAGEAFRPTLVLADAPSTIQ